MTYHIAICDDDSRDAGYVSELLHQWAQLRGCAVTEERFPSAEGFLFRYEEDRSFDRLKRRGPKLGAPLPGGGCMVAPFGGPAIFALAGGGPHLGGPRRFAYSGDWPEECTPASCP